MSFCILVICIRYPVNTGQYSPYIDYVMGMLLLCTNLTNRQLKWTQADDILKFVFSRMVKLEFDFHWLTCFDCTTTYTARVTRWGSLRVWALNLLQFTYLLHINWDWKIIFVLIILLCYLFYCPCLWAHKQAFPCFNGTNLEPITFKWTVNRRWAVYTVRKQRGQFYLNSYRIKEGRENLNHVC